MKQKIFTLLLFLGVVAFAYAQTEKPTGVIKKTSDAPVIDGLIDAVWDEANVYNIDKNFQAELPTLGDPGETTWEALWTADGIFILLKVTDDDFYPVYEAGGANDWEYDKPELYFDVNYVLDDAGGPGSGSGHYQVAPGFADGLNDGTPRTSGDVSFAFMVEDPNYIGEYFIPFSHLIDKDGLQIDLTANIGFDVTIIDRDAGDDARKRAVWANVGAITESWSNMDDCGIITFEGAATAINIESIALSKSSDITVNNQPLQIAATILPEDATNKNLAWSVESGTGRAKINSEGLLIPITDGTVTVWAKAQDKGYEEASIDVTISGQVVSIPEISLIRNGLFDQVTSTGAAVEWNGTNTVEDGVAILDPNPGGTDFWSFTFTQATFGCNTTDQYTFTFVLWADESDTVDVDFEDSANGYNRYGTSTHEYSIFTATDGSTSTNQSDWFFISNTEPTKYVFDVIFNEKLENTHESCQFMLGKHDPIVHLDSVMLYNNNDLALVSEPVAIPVTGITLTSAGDATKVAEGETLQMSATVTPNDATYQGAWFTVVEGSGEATIDPSTGVLTGVSAGTVTVVASAQDESGIKTSKEITVTWPVGIQQRNMNQNIKVFPNPASNNLTIDLPAANSQVTIFDGVGRKVDEFFATDKRITIDVSGYTRGIYFIKSNDQVTKFVK